MRFAKPVIAVSLCLCAAAAAAQTLSTEEDKTLYAVGLALGRNIENFGLTPAELALVTSGISDAALKKKPKVDLDTYGPKIQGLAQQRMSANATVEKKASAAFLEQMAKQPGAQREASGVIYIPEKEGTGEMPTAESTVKVNYHGTLRDGTVFDSSVQRGQPVTFPLNQVILVLDPRRAEDEGGRQGQARLPVRHRLRRHRSRPDPGRRRTGVRGRAARHREAIGRARSRRARRRLRSAPCRTPVTEAPPGFRAALL